MNMIGAIIKKIKRITLYRTIFQIVFCIILVVLQACERSSLFEKNNADGAINYDIEINYSDYSNRVKQEYFNDILSEDSLYVFIEVGFKNDRVSIFVNGMKKVEETLSTEDQSGYAEYYQFGHIEDIEHVAFRLNDGNLAIMEIKDKNLINVNLKKNRLIVSVLNNAPFYD